MVYGAFGRGPAPGERPSALDIFHDTGSSGPQQRRSPDVPADQAEIERQSRVNVAAGDPAIIAISKAVAGEAFDTLGLDEVTVFSERARERLQELEVPPDLIVEVHSTSLIHQAMLTEEAAARARLATNE